MRKLEELSSQELLDEITVRFNERESTINEMSIVMAKAEEMNKKLLKSEENKSKFMSIIKNEFNNPLFSIVSLSKTLLDISKDEKAILVSKSLQEEALLLNFQIKNIITATELESGTFLIESTKIDFNDIIEQIKYELQYAIEFKHINISVDNLVSNELFLDKNILLQILVNLLSNSVEFSPQNSKVEINISQSDDRCIVSIKDYGEGIAEHEQESIFQRFYQAHSGMNRAHRGQGLGLSIVRDLVTLCDGNMSFDSKLGEFTLFTISLPILSSEDSIFDDDFMFVGEDSGSEF